MINRAALYGDGFFETVLIHRGIILLRKFHEQRILRSSEILGFSNSLQLIHCFDQIKTDISEEWQRLRINFFRVSEGKYLPESNVAEWDFSIENMKSCPLNSSSAIKIHLYQQQYKAEGILSSVKSLSSLFYVLAAKDAANNHCHDSLILNTLSDAIELGSGNLFIIKDEKILTPEDLSGQVQGVAQSLLEKICHEEQIPLIKCKLKVNDVLLSDAAFRTNAITGITAINLNHSGEVSPLIQKIQTLYYKNLIKS